MAKPPSTPPDSDLEGVHRDGTRPSKPLPTGGQSAEELERAAREDVARPDHGSEESGDDRTS